MKKMKRMLAGVCVALLLCACTNSNANSDETLIKDAIVAFYTAPDETYLKEFDKAFSKANGEMIENPSWDDVSSIEMDYDSAMPKGLADYFSKDDLNVFVLYGDYQTATRKAGNKVSDISVSCEKVNDNNYNVTIKASINGKEKEYTDRVQVRDGKIVSIKFDEFKNEVTK